MILIDASPLQSEHRLRGVGAYVRELVRNLERSVPEPDRPHYLATRTPAEPLLPLGRTHRILRNHRPAQGYWLTNEVVLRAAMLRHRPSVFFATDFNGLVRNPFGCTAATLYDLTPLETGLGDPLSAARWKTYYRRVHHCDLLLAISEHTRRAAIQALGLDPAIVRTVPLGIDAERFVPSRGQGTSVGRPPYFLHIGGRNHNKNQGTLLEAFARVAREAPNVELLLGGPWRAADLAWLEAEKRRLGIAAIHHLGYVDEADLPSLYGNAIAFVFPSLAEGFGFPVLEAMACGTPVITSNCSSLPEVAGDAALLVDPRNPPALAAAMRTVIAGEDVPSLVRRGVARAREYTWAETTRKTWNLLTELDAHASARSRSKR